MERYQPVLFMKLVDKFMDKSDILDFLSSHKQEFKKKYAITKIGLFGSYANGSADEKSDIDIVIHSEKKDFFLRDDFKEYLQNKFNLPVDVGYIDSFRKFYKEKIKKDIIYV